ncbi:MAG: hypothetical protein ABSH25_22765 [Syntrophorhabdales bacterium]
MSSSLRTIDVSPPTRRVLPLIRREAALRSFPKEILPYEQEERIVARPTEGLVSNRAFTLPGSMRAVQAYRRSMQPSTPEPLFIDTYA